MPTFCLAGYLIFTASLMENIPTSPPPHSNQITDLQIALDCETRYAATLISRHRYRSAIQRLDAALENHPDNEQLLQLRCVAEQAIR